MPNPCAVRAPPNPGMSCASAADVGHWHGTISQRVGCKGSASQRSGEHYGHRSLNIVVLLVSAVLLSGIKCAPKQVGTCSTCSPFFLCSTKGYPTAQLIYISKDMGYGEDRGSDGSCA